MDTYIVGNWKMNQNLNDIESFFKELEDHAPANNIHAWIAPQTLHIQKCIESAPSFIKVGSQNCSQHTAGAYTGEASPTALKELGATFTLVGHSERRALYGECLGTVTEKTEAALAAGLTTILCIGENLEQREANETLNIVEEQISFLKELGYQSNLLIAYEPVWAIGTGLTASSEQAQEVHAFIRTFLSESWGEAEAKSVPLLYGGSVKPENVKELLAQSDINGALVGGASLTPTKFSKLYQQ